MSVFGQQIAYLWFRWKYGCKKYLQPSYEKIRVHRAAKRNM